MQGILPLFPDVTPEMQLVHHLPGTTAAKQPDEFRPAAGLTEFFV